MIDCQYRQDELKNINNNVALDNKALKIPLKVTYGSRIIITEDPGKLTILCFGDNYQDILSQATSNIKNLN